MKTLRLLLSLSLLSLTACAGLTARPAKLDPALAETAEVDWDRVVSDVEGILRERELEGPIVTRSDAATGGELWDLSLRQELALEASEADKLLALEYLRRVAEKAKQLDRLAQCGPWSWLCRRRARRAD